MNRRLLLLGPLALLFASIACGPHYDERIYEVRLMNQTDTPLSVAFVKKGPPGQEGWLAPEDVALMAPPLTVHRWGIELKPGESRILGPQRGLFASDSNGRLRIYAGNPTIEEMLGYGPDDPDRLELYLWPGKSSYVVKRENRRLIGLLQEK